jgi:alpha-galactosidase
LLTHRSSPSFRIFSHACCIALLVLAMGFAGATGVTAQTQATAATTEQDSSNLAPLPPMGWASWNHYFCDYDAQTIRDQADALVSSGMRDLGYKYVIIQECIAPGRDAAGNLVVDAQRFPQGIKALADYIHARGLKAGIYTDVGPYTCYPKPRYQGSFGHEEQDAKEFASWDIDLVEMDYCNKPVEHTGREIYERMAAAIQHSGRSMLFYICSWGNERPWEWAQGKAQVWRTDFDISLAKDHVDWDRMVRNFESNAQDADFTAPNSWNDPDMLEVGIPGMNAVEDQTHFSMWAISAAPLWAGTDLTHVDAMTRTIFTNKEVIVVDQDSLGAGVVEISGAANGPQVWAKPLESLTSGQKAVLLVNLGSAPASVAVRWSDLGLKPNARVRDLWLHRDLGSSRDSYSAVLPAHGSKLLRVTGQFDWAKGAVIEAEWPGNRRDGGSKLLDCGECSRGFGISIGNIDGATEGSLTIDRLDVPEAGEYKLELTYVRNGLGDKMIGMQVNGGTSSQVKALMREWNWVTIPVMLHAGRNTVTFTYAGKNVFDIDKVRLTR